MMIFSVLTEALVEILESVECAQLWCQYCMLLMIPCLMLVVMDFHSLLDGSLLDDSLLDDSLLGIYAR